ncbi:MAG: propionate CoA-transferase [Planctomycetes bacterium]|nr:propionate CoA-transferase [Planctomycetota bacterium]
MFKIVSARDAIDAIPDGACIGINSFLALSNPEALHQALTERYRETNHPGNLKLFCSAGFGGWDESRFAEPYVAAGAVREVVAGHFSSMPAVVRKALDNEIEAYNPPLGVLSHCVRAAAAGHDGLLSEVGLNIFADPRIGKLGLNQRSQKQLVSLVEVDGREYLYYKTPKIDVAFIRATSVDPNGNISMEKEYLTVDALALAQATKSNGGIVIVQVDSVSHIFKRPHTVIVPGILVDYVVVAEDDVSGQYNPSMSGDIHVPPTHMDYFMSKLSTSRKKKDTGDASPDIIGERAAHELTPGQVVNIGIGIPEMAGKYASKLGILKDIVTTVEAGGIGGLPAPGLAFGASIGADMICDMASQFDFYDGGGLDICFMGGLEADAAGNVNAHQSSSGFVGIGGFANITGATKNVVFCMTFTAKGLLTRRNGSRVEILQEGSIKKFKKDIAGISFAAKNAYRKRQRVLYVTERCVFELTPDGLRLKEVYDGIDEQKQVRDLLDFDV